MLRTLLAANPSPMTLDGTRTFIVGEERPAVIDPGPDDPAHLAAILEALAGKRPAAILVTHSHADHAELVPELARRTGAAVVADSNAIEVETDAGKLVPVRTPGHSPDHLSLLWNSPR